MNPLEFSLDFPRHLPEPTWCAGFRQQCSDFKVEEQLGFVPGGAGEHLYLRLRKEGQNTRWVAKILAEIFSVPEFSVGYCGLKDRHAITSQWFSVHLAGAAENRTLPEVEPIEGCELLEKSWHQRKLRRGSHRGNHFCILLRNVNIDPGHLESRLVAIRADGVPNYFGEQRFGIDGGNLHQVNRILAGRKPRLRDQRGGLYLSAARSWLFNLVLAARVRDGSWQRALPGETVPEGPLWGRGRNPAAGVVAELEAAVLQPWAAWCDGLEHSGLKQERRPLQLLPAGFEWCWQERDLQLQFTLPAGAYATAVLREIALLNPRNPVL